MPFQSLRIFLRHSVLHYQQQLLVESYHIVDLKQQNRLKVGTDNLTVYK